MKLGYILAASTASAGALEFSWENADKFATMAVLGVSSRQLCVFNRWEHCNHYGVIGLTGGAVATDIYRNRRTVMEAVLGTEVVQVLVEGLSGLKNTVSRVTRVLTSDDGLDDDAEF